MKTMAFSLYDNKAQFFNIPFFMPAKGQAIRAVIDLGSDLSTQVGRHPQDFILYVVGEFDTDNGVLTPCYPESLGPVSSYLPATQPTFPPPMSEYVQVDRASGAMRPNGAISE